MFRLEKLEIHGFKSFADRTTLAFGEGITGIVGPNGCGKSNVSEAISWVLGEQSAKSLRGGKMEDVIFNGTRDRKPTGMAEVILTMVATQDITSRNAEEKEKSDEEEYQEALENAERAATVARTLVQEFTPKEEAETQTGELIATTAQANEPTIAPAQLNESEAEAAVISTTDNPAPLVVADMTQGSADATVSEVENPQEAADVSAPTSTVDLIIEATPSHESLIEIEETKVAEAKAKIKKPKKKTISVMAGERVTIARRLYRSGESDYFMNGRHCLLRDIQDLFAGTGLGGSHYAIIEQGRIGQILSSKPLDRRALIEEAAGITKFKARKRTTELRLESARQNLLRLNDIISEVERQVNSLKRQAQRARRYKRLREEMRGLQRFVFVADYHRLEEASLRLTENLERATQEQKELEAQLAQLETEYQAVSGETRVAEDRLAELKERAAEIALHADRARNQRAFDAKQIEELATRIERLKEENEALETRLTQLDANKATCVERLKSLETELSAVQIDLRRHEEAYQQETARLREAEAEIEQLRQQMLREISATERLKNLSLSLEESLRKLELRQISLGNELDKATTRLEEATAEYARVGDEIEGGRLRIAELSEVISVRAKIIQELRAQASEQQQNLNRIRSERGAAEHRLKSLDDLDSHHAYYSDTVQQILSPEQAAKINALGTLADFVNVEPQYEKLVESLFSRELQCVMVPTIDDALTGVEFIKASGLGSGAFLVVGFHGGEGDSPDNPESDVWSESEDEFTGDLNPQQRQISDKSAQDEHRTRFHLEALTAGDLLGVRSEIKGVVERAFPAKFAALVAPDMEAALHLSIENPSRIYVTVEGEQVINGRLIVTNGIDAKKGTSLLALKREIRELRMQAEQLRQAEERLAASLTTTEQQMEATEAEKSQFDTELRQNEKEAAGRDSHFQGLARELERAKQYVRVVEGDIEQAATERRELESRIENLNAELQVAEDSRNHVQEAVSEKQAAFVEMRSSAETASEELSALRSAAAAQTERLQAARAEIRRIENEVEELHTRINRNRVESYESHNRIEQLSQSQSEGDSATQQLDSEGNSLAEAIQTASETLKTTRERSDALDTILRDIRPKSSTVRDERSHLEVEMARLESEAAHLARTCFSELAMSLEEVVAQSLGSGVWSPESAQPAGGESGEGEKTTEFEGSQKGEVGEENPGVEAIGGNEMTPDSLDAAKARLDELRVKIDDIGPVNMMALEELEEADERFKFLSDQRRDILDSIRLTEEALSEIKRRSRERFRHAYTHINQNFQLMFVELFGGGRGEMILIDEEDVLESGIDIIAQPPGKRLQSVLLLSGGEKAMSAIALVLAIFQYKPSPFCILDEVDAPLDEMNVGRFAGKVTEMSRETQFLVITHNKRTMESAKVLYGVTMEEPGISKLVSVKFE